MRYTRITGWWFYQAIRGAVMPTSLEPIRVQSLKDACISRLEGLILSGELQIG